MTSCGPAVANSDETVQGFRIHRLRVEGLGCQCCRNNLMKTFVPLCIVLLAQTYTDPIAKPSTTTKLPEGNTIVRADPAEAPDNSPKPQ